MHLLEGHEALGTTLFYLGKYPAAQMHLEQGTAFTDPAAQRALTVRYGVAPGVRCLAFAALTLWCLGAPTQALRRSQEALALAQALPVPRVWRWLGTAQPTCIIAAARRQRSRRRRRPS